MVGGFSDFASFLQWLRPLLTVDRMLHLVSKIAPAFQILAYGSAAVAAWFAWRQYRAARIIEISSFWRIYKFVLLAECCTKNS